MPSAQERREQRRFAFWMKVLDTGGSIISKAIPWAGLVLIAWFSKQSVAMLAGEKTFADIGIAFAANLKVSEAATYAFGVFGVGYGVLERRLRQRNIADLAKTIQELEKRIDPNRTSSSLTARGTTSAEDME